MTVRALYRVSQKAVEVTESAAPRDQKARAEIADYLDAALTRPLYGTSEEREQQIIAAIEGMSIQERVFIELEMRKSDGYSSDYDPLRF